MKSSTKHLKIQSSKLMNSLFLWNFKAAFHGKGIEFRDFREYSPSDDAKYIDWVRSSTEGTTIMRRYREEKEGNILCVMDARESLDFPDGEVKKQTMLSVVELIWNAALSSGESFWGYIVWGSMSYIRPKKHLSVISELQNVDSVGKRSLENINLHFLLQKSLKRSIVFLISDNLLYDKEILKTVSHKHDLIYVYIGSDFEERLRGFGVSGLSAWWTSIAVDFDDKQKKQIYISERQKLLESFTKDLKKIGIDSICLTESSSLALEFLKLMKLRVKK